MRVASLGVDDQLPQTLIDYGVKESQVVEAHRPAQQVLQNMPVEKHRAQLVLKQA